ncbi:MAG: sulfatase [Terriglobia bacterium]
MGRLLPLKTLSVLLAVVFVVSLLGVGVYAIRPSIYRARVAAIRPASAGKPNIILITLDTVRADHLSLYGYPRRTTPGIDKWARQGTVFENAIAASSWTLPSHASIFTGLLPHQHGADAAKPLDPSWWTLGDVLGSRGYETAGFTSNLDYGELGWGMGNGFEFYDDDSTSVRHNLRNLLLGSLILQKPYSMYVQPGPMDRRDARQINRDVLRWFQHRSPKPFYLFINYFDVHDPYLLPGHSPSRFGQVSPWLIRRIGSDLGEYGKGHISAEDTETLITSYDNCLAFLDASVDELLNSLSRLPGWDNTIVIITSDHGEAFGEHGAYGHGNSLYREEVHVPLVILGPHVPSGFRVSRLVGIQEIFETVLELSGMDNPPFQRASLQRFWRPGSDPGHFDEFVLSELSQTGISLTTPEWQYLRDSQGNEKLYHWVSDPEEKYDVSKSPEYQNMLRDLQIQLGATVTNSVRPWKGRDYLSALGGSERFWAEVARMSPDPDSISAHPLRPPMGTSQAFFPRRGSTSTQRPPSADQELLRSLPYH